MAQQLFELLKKDHRQAEQLMKEILSSSEEKREEIFDELKRALNEHMQIEEKYFYPKIKNFAEMKEMVQDALEEHKEAKEYLLELDEMDFTNHVWQEMFHKMQEGIQHHVQDEEKKIFPQSAKVMSQQQLKEIGELCAQEKQKSRPSRTAVATGRTKPPAGRHPRA